VRLNECRSVLLVWVLAAAVPNPRAAAQSAADVVNPIAGIASNDLITSLQAESKRGTAVFYTQSYRAHGRRIEFHGSIFGEIQDAQVEGCELKITSEIVDHYSGTVGGALIGQTQIKYTTSINIELTPKMAADLKIVVGRPARQLTEGTNPVCSGERQCNLTWLKLQADASVIRVIEITNDVADYDGDVKDFDGSVDHLFLPLSSKEAGDDLIAKMRVFARSCPRSSTVSTRR
jgi:hypothetical protein